ncbi:low molecular weight phosphotyrosine protein phosphatase [Flavobacterium agricola]|uniref:protein-tyrosine-phosphatase n=1 Tax=Flavobacterium agricola TaxID=2870839 RepID=A0ABY6M2D7_9FLAO|nr:low molecular weight protein-tyrosine-phosphatase [Flavobacterium agricola]UYW01438.1 low molecular weight phosphotyrosine protein phosphatase [Flavobacterium agricola]
MSTKVLMVCLGNICRSPLAHGILESKIEPEMQVKVDSAGTAAWHSGKQPDERSIAIAKQNGIDISNQKARQFTVEDFNAFDYIYVMDQSNYKDVMKLAPNDATRAKVEIILNEIYPEENREVPDPYYGGTSGFTTVYNLLDQACDKIIHKLKNAK